MINQHKQKVHGVTLDQAGFDYPCKLCDKIFNVHRGLLMHMSRIHPDGKPAPEKEETQAVCTFCGAVFKTAQGLQVHVGKRHTAEADMPLA